MSHDLFNVRTQSGRSLPTCKFTLSALTRLTLIVAGLIWSGGGEVRV